MTKDISEELVKEEPYITKTINWTLNFLKVKAKVVPIKHLEECKKFLDEIIPQKKLEEKKRDEEKSKYVSSVNKTVVKGKTLLQQEI